MTRKVPLDYWSDIHRVVYPFDETLHDFDTLGVRCGLISVLYPLFLFGCAALVFCHFKGLTEAVIERKGNYAAISFDLKIFAGVGEGCQPGEGTRVKHIPEAEFDGSFFL
jgi:hypothetical protein